MTRREVLNEFNCFQLAVFFLLEGNDLAVALEKNEMTQSQRERFAKIEAVYLEEQLKDCPF